MLAWGGAERAEAVRTGLPVTAASTSGVHVWSFMDNFEWAWGYDRRFGLADVDYASQRRLVKDSGRWDANVAAPRPLHDASPAGRRATA